MRRSRAPAVSAGVGIALFASVVAVRLLDATEKADAQTLCDGEGRSGFSMRAELGAVDAWIVAHLRTRTMETTFAGIRDAPLPERAARLRELARRVGVTRCRLADTYDALADEAIYRAELQTICSYATFPGLGERGDDAKSAAIEAWIRERARVPRTELLGQTLGEARAPDRAALLRDVAREIGVRSCDVAKLIDVPPRLTCLP